MERRLNDRQPFRRPVRVRLDDAEPSDVDLDISALDDTATLEDTFVLDSCDVCSGGVFLQTNILFSLGDWLHLAIPVPGRRRPIISRGQVVRVVFDKDIPGVAIKLNPLDAAENTALKRASFTLDNSRPRA